MQAWTDKGSDAGELRLLGTGSSIGNNATKSRDRAAQRGGQLLLKVMREKGRRTDKRSASGGTGVRAEGIGRGGRATRRGGGKNRLWSKLAIAKAPNPWPFLMLHWARAPRWSFYVGGSAISELCYDRAQTLTIYLHRRKSSTRSRIFRCSNSCAGSERHRRAEYWNLNVRG